MEHARPNAVERHVRGLRRIVSVCHSARAVIEVCIVEYEDSWLDTKIPSRRPPPTFWKISSTIFDMTKKTENGRFQMLKSQVFATGTEGGSNEYRKN